MIFQIYVRFLVAVVVLASLGSASSEKPNMLNASQDMKEEWIWAYNVSDSNSNTVAHEVAHWNYVWEDNGTRAIDEEEKNWCALLELPAFEKTNFSRFQLTRNCCREHFHSVPLDIYGGVHRKCSDYSKFYNCLKNVNTTMSRSVRSHYFKKKMHTSCYDIQKQEDGCDGTACIVIVKISKSFVTL